MEGVRAHRLPCHEDTQAGTASFRSKTLALVVPRRPAYSNNSALFFRQPKPSTTTDLKRLDGPKLRHTFQTLPTVNFIQREPEFQRCSPTLLLDRFPVGVDDLDRLLTLPHPR